MGREASGRPAGCSGLVPSEAQSRRHEAGDQGGGAGAAARAEGNVSDGETGGNSDSGRQKRMLGPMRLGAAIGEARVGDGGGGGTGSLTERQLLSEGARGCEEKGSDL